MPISRIATASNVLVVNVSLPAKSVAELVQLAKEKPGALNYASAGVGTPAHLAGEMLNLLAGIKLTHVPVQGRRARRCSTSSPATRSSSSPRRSPPART